MCCTRLELLLSAPTPQHTHTLSKFNKCTEHYLYRTVVDCVSRDLGNCCLSGVGLRFLAVRWCLLLVISHYSPNSRRKSKRRSDVARDLHLHCDNLHSAILQCRFYLFSFKNRVSPTNCPHHHRFNFITECIRHMWIVQTYPMLTEKQICTIKNTMGRVLHEQSTLKICLTVVRPICDVWMWNKDAEAVEK